MLAKFKSASRKALSIMLVFVMSVTAFVLCNPIEADAIGKDAYVDGRYYYYPEGTEFISSIQFGVDDSRDKAESAATANGHILLGNSNPNDSAMYNMNYKSNDSSGDYPYIFLGYKTTKDINQALGTALRASIDLTGGVTDYNFTVKLNTGGTASVPFKIANTTDLNKGMGKDTPYIYLYYHDPAEYSQTLPGLGLPIVSLRGWSNPPKTSAGYSIDDIKYVPYNNTEEIADFDEGISGAGWVYLFYDNVSVYTNVTEKVQSLISVLEETSKVKDQSFYTAESWAAYQTALAKANEVWGAYNNAYKAGNVPADKIDEAVANLGRAMDSLATTIRLDAVTNGGTTTITEYVVNCGLRDKVDFPAGDYSATKAGSNFLGWNTDRNASAGTKSTMSVPLNSTVYAIFAVTMHSVYFSNPITYQTISYQEVAHGAAATAPVMDKYQYITKDADTHYVFSGWDKDYSKITEGTTVHAVYTEAAHNYERVEYIAASCVKAGSEIYRCSDCGQEKTITLPQDANTHKNTQYFGAKPSTCKEYGYTEYTYCNDCKKVVSGREILPLADCTWSDWTEKAPTCEIAGSKSRKCAVCGKTESESIPALGHEWGDWTVVKEATCNAEGRRQRVCPVCSTTQVEMIPAVEHIYNAVVTPPTCTEKGYTTHTCERNCGNSYIDTYVDALGHEWEDVGEPEKEAGCISAGSQYQECAVCGSSRIATVPALGHDWQNEVIIKDATCDSDGFMNATCGRCNTTQENIVIDALGHDWDEGTVTKEATCTEDGNILLTCQRDCGKTMNITVRALGHDWEDGEVTTAPTCEHEGKMIVICKVCLAEDTVDVPKLSHKYTGVVTEPTCVDQGYTEYKCSDCGDEVIDDYVPALGHSFSITVVPPTCIKDGYTFARCSNCEFTQKTNFINALGHNYVTSTVAPTCTEKGYDNHVCTRGDSTYRDNYVDALGHSYDMTTVEPTCTEKGYDLYECAACDSYYKNNYVNAKGHSYTEVERVEPWGTQSGYVLYVCDGCGRENKEPIFRDDKALVCITLYDQFGAPVTEATIEVTELNSGNTFTLYTDLNGYFTEVLYEGDYALVIKKRGYEDTYGTIIVADGDAEISIPAVEMIECDCNCHKDDIWAKIWRIFMKIRMFLGLEVNCCADPEM